MVNSQPNSPGTLLKTDQATIYWVGENPNASVPYNSTGFSAIGSGARTSVSNFFAQLDDFMMWTSSQTTGTTAGFIDIYYLGEWLVYYPEGSWSNNFQAGNAIRCLKD